MSYRKRGNAGRVVAGVVLSLAIVGGGLAVGLGWGTNWKYDNIIKSEKPAEENKPAEELSTSWGRVYNARTNQQLDSGEVYAMPAALLFTQNIATELIEDSRLVAPGLTVTVAKALPYNNIKVDWSAKYIDGTDASDKVQIIPESDGALTARVTALGNFSRKITIRATSRDDVTKYATCTADFVSRISEVNNADVGFTDFGDGAGLSIKPVFEGGTVRGELVLNYVTYHVSDALQANIKSRLSFDIEFTGARYDYHATTMRAFKRGDDTWYAAADNGSTIEIEDFIRGFNQLEAAKKQAIYYAWYNANKALPAATSTITADFELVLKYGAVELQSYQETEYAGFLQPARIMCDEGADIDPQLTLNAEVVL